jgi:hypothetical protein
MNGWQSFDLPFCGPAFRSHKELQHLPLAAHTGINGAHKTRAGDYVAFRIRDVEQRPMILSTIAPKVDGYRNSKRLIRRKNRSRQEDHG